MQEIKDLPVGFISRAATQSNSYTGLWDWIIQLAQSCEQLWNESGRKAATSFVRENTDLPTLRLGLSEGSELVRTKALHLMSLWDSPEIIADLGGSLRFDPCPIVRHEAAYFLGMTHAVSALEALGISLLNDDSELVRHEAAEAIGELGLPGGFPWLAQCRNDPSTLVRKTAEIAQSNIQLNVSNDARSTTHKSL